MRHRALSRKNLWECVPHFVKRIMSPFLQRIPPAVLLGKAFRRQLQLAKAADRWPEGEARDYQLAAVKGIVQHAYRRCRFYRRMFDDAGFDPSGMKSLEQLERLPTIDAETVRNQANSMRARSLLFGNADLISTGGTGGRPLQFWCNPQRSSFELAHLVAGWERCGYRLGMPLAVLRGRVVRQSSSLGLRQEYEPILRCHYYSSFHLDEESTRDYIEHIRTLGPCFLHVYPSAIATLVRFMGHSRIKPPTNVLGIIAESEIVYTEQREHVEAALGCRYFSCYGQSEKVVLACECESSTDYHVLPTYGYFELVDEHDRSITTPGQRGEIVGTGFVNRAMPLIRYRTGDYATYVGRQCQTCHREQVIIRDIRGHRTQEVLLASDGSEISWAALNMHDDTFAGVKQFQFRQDVRGHATLQVVPLKELSRADLQQIQARLEQKLGGRVSLNLKIVARIPLTTRGKAIYVDQQIQA